VSIAAGTVWRSSCAQHTWWRELGVRDIPLTRDRLYLTPSLPTCLKRREYKKTTKEKKTPKKGRK
jgi:hypothetical protein